jgi:phosphoribulokinase
MFPILKKKILDYLRYIESQYNIDHYDFQIKCNSIITGSTVMTRYTISELILEITNETDDGLQILYYWLQLGIENQLEEFLNEG